MESDKQNSEKETIDSLKEELRKTHEKLDKIQANVNTQNSLKHHKSEGITILLSLILGLIGIMGIGHIYIGKKAVGVSILVSSIFLGMYTIAGLNTWGFIDVYPALQNNLTPEQKTTSLTLTFAVSIGYIALYIGQIIHSWQLCKKFNKNLENKHQ